MNSTAARHSEYDMAANFLTSGDSEWIRRPSRADGFIALVRLRHHARVISPGLRVKTLRKMK